MNQNNMSKVDRTTEIFRNAPIPKAVFYNIVPSVVSMLMVMVYNLADTFFSYLQRVPSMSKNITAGIIYSAPSPNRSETSCIIVFVAL